MKGGVAGNCYNVVKLGGAGGNVGAAAYVVNHDGVLGAQDVGLDVAAYVIYCYGHGMKILWKIKIDDAAKSGAGFFFAGFYCENTVAVLAQNLRNFFKVVAANFYRNFISVNLRNNEIFPNQGDLHAVNL